MEPVRVPQPRHARQGVGCVQGRLGTRKAGEETQRQLLAKALRPFILRRTKEQVAKDLPEKTEQTLYCEMEPDQRKLYNELRDHYRLVAARTRSSSDGIDKSKIQILEALLRLRQAAMPSRPDRQGQATGESSAKLDVLLPQLHEVFDEGHKALVFSQFTSMLAIVRQRLDAEEIPTSTSTAGPATARRGWSVSRTTRIASCS